MAVLRRLAALALVLALGIAVVPRILGELGVIGPGVDGEVDAAARAVEVARTYGATPDQAPLAEAQRGLDLARQLAAAGKGHEARRAARAARDRAIEAQRLALTVHDEKRRRAKTVVDDVDKKMSELEDAYSEASPGLDKPTASRLLSLMKGARQTGGGLVLAYEQGEYDKVIADEKAARKALTSARDAVKSARKPPR